MIGCSSHRRAPEGFRRRAYTSAEIDAIAAYSPDEARCYLLPVKLVEGRSSIQLRLEPARNHQRGAINWAEEFEFSTLDWTAAAADGAVAQLEERLAGSEEAGGSSPPSSTSSSELATIGSHEFRNHFGYWLDRAAAGQELLVTRHGRPYARLVPPSDQPSQPSRSAPASLTSS